MPHITIIETRLVPSPDARRAGQNDTLVLYRVENRASPGQVRMPTDNPSVAQVEAAIREKERTVRPFEGHQFTL